MQWAAVKTYFGWIIIPPQMNLLTFITEARYCRSVLNEPQWFVSAETEKFYAVKLLLEFLLTFYNK